MLCRELLPSPVAGVRLRDFHNNEARGGNGVDCFHCGSNELRLSHLRGQDFAELFLLQVPVRCRVCYERFYANVFRAWRDGLLGKHSKREHHDGKAKDGSAIA